MPETELRAPSGHYFAFPRLLMKWSNGDARRTESSAVEANVIGIATFAISYLFLVRLLLADGEWWSRWLIGVLLVLATFLFLTVAIYLLSLVGCMLRRIGFMRGVSDSRAQSLLVAAFTTLLAFYLIQTESWMRIAGAIWIGGVILNLLAAAILAGSQADDPIQ
jgi:hypothetical protein